MLSNLQRKVAFFRDCLDLESRAQTLWNIRSAKSELVREFKIDEIDSFPDAVAVSESYTESAIKVLDRYNREKQMILCRGFIIAYHDIASLGGGKRARKICCPILYYPCEIEGEIAAGAASSGGRIQPQLDRGVINPAAELFFKHYAIDAEQALEQLLALSAKADGQQQFVAVLNQLVEQLVDKASDMQVFGLDEISSTAQCLKKLQKDTLYIKQETLSCVVRKQQSGQGALHELELLVDTNIASAPMAGILQEGHSSSWFPQMPGFNLFGTRRRKIVDVPLPVVLSNAQTDVLNNAEQNAVSVVNGPPGTGKSFTIAALAVKAFMQGQSVLVVSQNQHAVDVVRRKLINDFGIDAGLTVLGSESGVSREVKEQILELMRVQEPCSYVDYKKVAKAVRGKQAEYASLERYFLAQCAKYTRMAGQSTSGRSVFSWLKRLTSRQPKALTADGLLSDPCSKLESLDADVNQAIARLINTLYKFNVYRAYCSRPQRKSLSEFAKSLTARNEFYQSKYYQQVEFRHVLNVLPFWFSAASNLHRLLPLEKELFDMVIIDEATQCNLSVCLPALYRAKKAVIVGDPKQLGHVSFVSTEAQRQLHDRYQLQASGLNSDYRNNSVLHYAMHTAFESGAVAQLDEHFRSHPQIIDFSNKEFYQQSLKVMTQKPGLLESAVVIEQVVGRRVRGVNIEEANAVVQRVTAIIAEQEDLASTEAHSLGVLSFFSDQAELIEKQLFSSVSLNALRKHNVRVGTPFSFQGEERDHMLISCCVDKNTSGSAYTYLNRDDVFNVAITRARDFQTLFLSCSVDEIVGTSKLKAYFNHIIESANQHNTSQLHTQSNDAFQNEVCAQLNLKGIDTYKNYMVAGITIDIMAVFEGRAIAIDLVGFAGPSVNVLSLTQFQLLARAGLDSFVLPFEEWQSRQENVLESLLLRIGAVFKIDRNTDVVDIFDENEVALVERLSNGLSINVLNARFARNGELKAIQQIRLLLDKRTALIRLLDDYFLQGELTYRRYLNAFDDLLAHCLQNLQQASVAVELSETLLEQQKLLFNRASYAEEQTDILAARNDMIEEQNAKVQHFLRLNERSLFQMDKTMVELTRLKEDKEGGQEHAELILQELAQKTDQFKGLTLVDNRDNKEQINS